MAAGCGRVADAVPGEDAVAEMQVQVTADHAAFATDTGEEHPFERVGQQRLQEGQRRRHDAPVRGSRCIERVVLGKVALVTRSRHHRAAFQPAVALIALAVGEPGERDGLGVGFEVDDRGG
jgi:hypothetical protein